MRRLLPSALMIMVAVGCGGQEAAQPAQQTAVVVDSAGVEIGAYSAGVLRGSEPEMLALVDTWVSSSLTLSSFDDPVTIATSLDSELQDQLRHVLAAKLPPASADGAAVVLNRVDGAVLAIASNNYGEAGALDVLIGAGRPTGSALKPIALAAALDSGLTLDSRFAAPECIALPDDPGDQTCGGTGGTASLLEATVASLNPVYVQVVDKIGVGRFGDLAAELGITSGATFRASDSVLGVNPVSVLEMATAYRAIAEGGQYTEPTAVTEVDTPQRVLGQSAPSLIEVLTPEVWEQVDHALELVVSRGTGLSADPGFPVAGKTGTARGLTDAWFVGYTDSLVVAVWVGFAAEPDKAMVFPATPITVTGGTLPAQIWSEFVSLVSRG